MSGSIGVKKEFHPLHSISVQLTTLSRENVPFSTFIQKILWDFLEPYDCFRLALWLRQDEEFLKANLELGEGQRSFDMKACDTLEGAEVFDAAAAGVRRRGARDAEGDGRRSALLVPIGHPELLIGVMELELDGSRTLGAPELHALEDAAQALGFAITSFRSQGDLRERVKELTCLYGIAKLAAKPGVSLDELLQGIVELLPPAWQYPEMASARIDVDDRSYTTKAAQSGAHRQAADIVVAGVCRGFVEVTYGCEVPMMGKSPFLEWEGRLINGVARQIELIIERRQSEEQRRELQEQLRHADRLATIGQLTAGVAHELNEPLANILGFAQLVLKDEALSEQIARDIKRIETASLHAREVIRKLMIFSRQMPQRTTRIALNQLVEDGLYFLASRCAKAGVELRRELAVDLPEIDVDPSQMNQVLVNLVVNAVQAMPEGGVLTVRTSLESGAVMLTVEDTGQGMTEEVKRQIFLPFFTTKEVDRGTGLGLAVVHGIVTSFGGGIEVETVVGEGTRFTIRIPVGGEGKCEEHEATFG